MPDRKSFQSPKLVAIEDIAPSTYNPRQADPARLDLVELSLRKLGWLLPIYAEKGGEILSGHQRHHVAARMGATHIPVVFLDMSDEWNRRSYNIAFNRATNDMARTDLSEDIGKRFRDLDEAASGVPDKEVNSDEWYPCMRYQFEPVEPIFRKNCHLWDQYARALANSMAASNILMPCILDEEGNVVNGVGRIEAYAERGFTELQTLRLPAAEARLATMMLNLISMDFDIHNRYADVLRYNSFRRTRGTKENIGLAFIFDCFGDKVAARDVDLSDPSDVQKWKRHYGESVLDFGAGLRQDVGRLREMGVAATPFEPFVLKPGADEVDPDAGRALVREFLHEVAAGRVWDSIFQNSIMNSVPFLQDRLHIVTLLAALCAAKTKVYVAAISTKAPRYIVHTGTTYQSSRFAQSLAFKLNYEPGVVIGDFMSSSLPKVQKFHTPREWHELWSTRFSWVHAREGAADLVIATCKRPKPIVPADLRAAIEYEFDLPYPDGTRMGLVDEALAAFSNRLDISL